MIATTFIAGFPADVFACLAVAYLVLLVAVVVIFLPTKRSQRAFEPESLGGEATYKPRAQHQWKGGAKVALSLVCLLLVGCNSRPHLNPPVVRASSKIEAARLTWEWAGKDPANRTWSTAGYTGSMKPLLYGGEYLMLRRYTPGMPVGAGQIIVFDRWTTRADYTNVIHRVVCSSDRTGAFFAMGDNCSRPDGWFSKERIKFICEGIVTFPNRNVQTARR